MRGLAITAITLSIAVPASADMAVLRLPLAPPGMDYVDTSCFVDAPRRLDLTRVQADGKVLRMNYAKGLTTGRATPLEVRQILRSLDQADFRDRLLPRLTSGYTTCSLSYRRGGATKQARVQLANGWGPRPMGMVAILETMDAIGRRAVRPVAAPGDERKK